MIRILWQDPFGPEQIANARLVDVSTTGIRLLVDRQIRVGSYVLCNEPRLKISGRGTVRYCRMHRAQFQIGVEFTDGTGWKPTGELVSTAIDCNTD